MDGYRMHFAWITILCLLQDYGRCANILEGPKNLTVFVGSNANFKCIVGAEWKSLSWFLQNIFIVSVSRPGTTISDIYNIIVQNSTNSTTGAFTSEITIVNVKTTDSGVVRCSSLSASFRDAYLTVQERSSGLSQRDIILIAVFVSLGGLLLLIIIIIVIIVFCCKRNKKKKKESGYQSDAWKDQEKRDNSLSTTQTDRVGEHNFAYMPDLVPVRQSFASNDGNNSNYYETRSTSTASSVQDPVQKWTDTDNTDNHLKQIRHMTHV